MERFMRISVVNLIVVLSAFLMPRDAFAQITNFRLFNRIQRDEQRLLIESRMHVEETQKTEVIRNPMDLRIATERLQDKAREGQQRARDKQKDLEAKSAMVTAMTDKSKEEAKRLLELQEMKQQAQEIKQQNQRLLIESMKQKAKDSARYNRSR